ncbi:MAG: radical SAM protein, partial [Candidatus Omnitrophica bacterium]|nr:radical SAM protein [Candidatus Omnitrophota bacterium]
MCYAIPGKVREIQGKTVVVDYFGELKKAHNEIDELRIGDYIYAQGGYVIERIGVTEAEEILAVWKETFFELQEVDVRLSRLDFEKSGLERRFGMILDQAMEGIAPAKEDLLYLLRFEDARHEELLFKTANFIRQKYLKNSCCVHGILEISNYCRSRCHYCGISLHNASIQRYRMSVDEIVESACEAVRQYGFKALVLQSGEDGAYRIDELSQVIRTIKAKAPALICVSFGEIGIEGLAELYEAGARGVLMRFETSNRALYQKLHSGDSLETRLDHIRAAYEMGFLVMTGGLIGLPGQTLEDRVDDLYLARELHAEMYSFGPFLPHPDTPLGGVQPVVEADVLKMIAAGRLIDASGSRILITTAFETLSPEA